MHFTLKYKKSIKGSQNRKICCKSEGANEMTLYTDTLPFTENTHVFDLVQH